MEILMLLHAATDTEGCGTEPCGCECNYRVHVGVHDRAAGGLLVATSVESITND